MRFTIRHAPRPSRGVAYGIRRLITALEARGHSASRRIRGPWAVSPGEIVVGPASEPGPAGRLVRSLGISVPDRPESLVIARLGEEPDAPLLLTGSDDRGTMYATLEVTIRVGWVDDPERPFQHVRPTVETPFVPERALSIYTMHRKTFEQRFFDAAYWDRYLDLLAENRFSTFVLLFAYESSGHLAPPYPYFFHVEGFPEVRVVGWSPADQARYSAALRRLIDAVHDHGLSFTLGIWDHIYRGGVQRGPEEEDTAIPEGRVTGVTAENLVAVNATGLTQLVQRFPEIDAIQFRMHGESGLTREEMSRFWETLYDVMRTHAPHMRFDARVKELPDALIDRALEKGLQFRLCTKYWMEQMGLPFHPSHIHPNNQRDRRHSYADLLRYPKRYTLHWRLWNGGTNRVLLWGSPEYVRRFAASTHLYGGEGYEVNEPLATKMAGQPHDEEPFALHRPEVRFYEWEFQRYWHFFQVFGRMGYHPETSPEVWEHEFCRRFGAAGTPLRRALHAASWVLPTIVAYNYPYRLFPTTRGWIEKQRMGDLPEYAAALPSDTEQFLSFEEAARVALEELESGKRHPLRTRERFLALARGIRQNLDAAERTVGPFRDSEYLTTRADLKILAGLAQYHAERIVAGLYWKLYERSGDLNALDHAVQAEAKAVNAWVRIVRAATPVYADTLKMGVRRAGLTGHWRDELAALRQGLERLQKLAQAATPPQPEDAPFLAHVPPDPVDPGQRLMLEATARMANNSGRVRVQVWPGPDESPFWLTMDPVGPYRFRVRLPALWVRPGLRYALVVVDGQGRETRWPQDPSGFSVRVTTDRTPPHVEHQPPAEVRLGEPVRLTARVEDPSGVRWVRVRHRPVTQFEDYRTVPMHPVSGTDHWEAVIPPDPMWERYDWMYFLEVMDEAGNGALYPSLEEETPYFVVPVRRDSGLS